VSRSRANPPFFCTHGGPTDAGCSNPDNGIVEEAWRVFLSLTGRLFRNRAVPGWGAQGIHSGRLYTVPGSVNRLSYSTEQQFEKFEERDLSPHVSLPLVRMTGQVGALPSPSANLYRTVESDA